MTQNIYCLKPVKDKLLNGFAAWLKMKGIGANAVTFSGLAAGLIGAACLLLKQNAVALVLLGLSIGADMLDGTVARLEKQEKLSGKLLDSVCDRMVETAWISALILISVFHIWACALAIASFSLFLCRVWAHRLGISSSAVMVTRFERICALVLGVVFQRQVVSAIIYTMITVGTFISCIQILSMILQTEFRVKSEARRVT